THNRLLALSGEAFARCYLEIIAIDPDAPEPGRARWFGMDAPALQAALRESPRFIHAVARTPNIEMHRWGLINLGLDPGVPLAAERATPNGKLAWRIAVRDDGAIECGGRLPTLIEWQGRHPADAMPASGLALQALTQGGLPPRVASVLRLRFIDNAAPDRLQAVIDTPRGPVTLTAWRPDQDDEH
ncbi:MAG: VOC family protein, partial [Burkholderiales bacterium]|nr:VOC family protein [Burkholderiales bacterium]